MTAYDGYGLEWRRGRAANAAVIYRDRVIVNVSVIVNVNRSIYLRFC
jgi:hypothetical protein